MNDLEQILYVSRAPALSQASVRSILELSRRNNRRNDVTGCLIYTGAHFAQVLEGRHDTLLALARRIERDPRHSECTWLARQSVEARQYGEWSMGYVFRQDVADQIEGLSRQHSLAFETLSQVIGMIQPDSVMGPL